MRQFLVVVCAVVALARPTESYALKLTLGIPRQGETNILTGDTLKAELLRNVLFARLLRPQNTTPGFALWAASSMRVSEQVLRIVLRPELVFADGTRLRTADTLYSLKRCLKSPSLDVEIADDGALLFSLSSPLQKFTPIHENAVIQEFNAMNLLDLFSRCPVLPERSMRFDEMLGRNFSIIASGPYIIGDKSTPHTITLFRNSRYVGNHSGAESITLQEFNDEAKMLSALRSGSLDAIWLTQEEPLRKAQNDQTLRVSSCGASMIVSRVGLQVSCAPFIELDRWHYDNA